MSTIADIVAAAHGRAGKWHVTRVTYNDTSPPREYATLYHYSTAMLTWRVDNPAEPIAISLGHGSVSDQAGMNQAFRILGMPLYYSRAGGARIVDGTDTRRDDYIRSGLDWETYCLRHPLPTYRRWRKGRGVVEYVYAPKGYERVAAMGGRVTYERIAS